MILPNFVLPSRVNQHWQYSGMDSIEHCRNKDYFQSYPHPVDYVYNSRGFRDAEWPNTLDELKNAIWCVGDSFTVGIGSPYKFTWPQVLSAATGRRCINIGMDGASNSWISRRAQQIVKEVAPAHMVVLWSYTHRREHSNIEWSDENRRIHHSARLSSDEDNFANFVNCYTQLNTAATSTDIFNGAIPHFWAKIDMNFWKDVRDPSWPVNCPQSRSEFAALPEYVQQELLSQLYIKNKFELLFAPNEPTNHQLIQLTNLDYARDYHHFDDVTSKFFVDAICKTLFSSNQSS